jgi:GLPGLI family protein
MDSVSADHQQPQIKSNMKILSLCVAIGLSLSAFSQAKEGVITYEQVIKIDTERFPPEMRSMIPPERKSTMQLLFTEKESIYKAVKNEEDINQELTAGEGTQMRIRMKGASDDEMYSNLETGESTQKTEFFGRIFLVQADGNDIEWKMTSDMKMVGKYQCMKATYMRDTIPVAVWFTPQIPVSLGPGEYKGLPGMILYVDVNDGRQTITATNLDLRPLTEEEVIETPTKGKKISREDFKKVQEEKMKEMQEMHGGRAGSGGTFIIRN